MMIVGKYWQMYLCVLPLHGGPFGVPFYLFYHDMIVCQQVLANVFMHFALHDGVLFGYNI